MISRKEEAKIRRIRREFTVCVRHENGEEFACPSRKAWELYDSEPEAILQMLGPATAFITRGDVRYELSVKNPKGWPVPCYSSSVVNLPCRHSALEVTGYVVAYSFLSGNVMFKDIAYIEDPQQYQQAVEARGAAQAKIASGSVKASGVVIQPVYACGHRIV